MTSTTFFSFIKSPYFVIIAVIFSYLRLMFSLTKVSFTYSPVFSIVFLIAAILMGAVFTLILFKVFFKYYPSRIIWGKYDVHFLFKHLVLSNGLLFGFILFILGLNLFPQLYYNIIVFVGTTIIFLFILFLKFLVILSRFVIIGLWWYIRVYGISSLHRFIWSKLFIIPKQRFGLKSTIISAPIIFSLVASIHALDHYSELANGREDMAIAMHDTDKLVKKIDSTLYDPQYTQARINFYNWKNTIFTQLIEDYNTRNTAMDRAYIRRLAGYNETRMDFCLKDFTNIYTSSELQLLENSRELFSNLKHGDTEAVMPRTEASVRIHGILGELAIRKENSALTMEVKKLLGETNPFNIKR